MLTGSRRAPGSWSAPDLVATNAHVVAGEGATRLERSDGSMADATVVAFDPERDLALLRRPGWTGRRCPIGDTGRRRPRRGVRAPGRRSAAARAVPGRRQRTGHRVTTSTTAARSRRDVLFLLGRAATRATRARRWSTASGRVVGVAFAIAPDKPGVAYALEHVDELPRRPGRTTVGPRRARGACVA